MKIMRIAPAQAIRNCENIAKTTKDASQFAPKTISFEPGDMKLPSLTEKLQNSPKFMKMYNSVMSILESVIH